MKTNLLASFYILLLVTLSNGLVQGKQPDIIQYNETSCELRTNGTKPLKIYFLTTDTAPPFRKCSFWQHREYIASWEIDDKKIYLVGIQTKDKVKGDHFTWNPKTECTEIDIRSIFPDADDSSRVLADWFTGNLLAQAGKERYEVRNGWTSTRYDKNVFLQIKNGRVIKETPLTAGQYRYEMQEYYEKRYKPEDISGPAAAYQQYLYVHSPGNNDSSDKEYSKDREEWVRIMEILNSKDWKYTIDAVTLTPDKFTSCDSTLTYLGDFPLYIDIRGFLNFPRPELRLWGQDCSYCYVMRPQANEFGSSTAPFVNPGPPGYQVVLPGDTFHIHWTTDNKARTEFVKSTNIHGDYHRNDWGVKLPVGREYLIDGYITVYGSSNCDSLFLTGTDIYSSSKVRALVEMPDKETTQTSP